jgi:ribosome-binding protein aMBF1 (putative translation factor)
MIKNASKYKKELSKEFEVAESTVLRWESGIANPRPNIKKLIEKYIESLEKK